MGAACQTLRVPSAGTLLTLAAGRPPAVADLRGLADALEALALDDAGEALVLLEPSLQHLARVPHLTLPQPRRSAAAAPGYSRLTRNLTDEEWRRFQTQDGPRRVICAELP